MKQDFLVLTINPGSTSTKVAIFKSNLMVYGETIRHKMEELSQFKTVLDQYPFRKLVILENLTNANIDLEQLDAVVGRGGLLRPVQGGTYKVAAPMLEDLKNNPRGEHASNLGALIAFEIANVYGIPSYIVDPVVVDEMTDLARITGWPELQRRSQFHALNQKAIARRAATDLGIKLEESNFIVAHLGGGISIGAHQLGKVIDVNQALDGEGPFSPERSGTLPMGDLVKLCFSGKYSLDTIQEKLVGKGGLMAYFATSDARVIETMIKNGNKQAEIVYEAMAYQVAKYIGSAATVLKGKVDAILLTGGLAYGDRLINWIRERVEFLAPILIYPGEDEMMAMNEGVLRVLQGLEEAKEYL